MFINLDKHHSFLKISILDLGNNCELPQNYYDFSILFFFQKFRFSSIVLCAGCKMNVVYKFSKVIDSKGAPNVILFDWITKSPICKEISSKNALSWMILNEWIWAKKEERHPVPKIWIWIFFLPLKPNYRECYVFIIH